MLPYRSVVFHINSGLFRNACATSSAPRFLREFPFAGCLVVIALRRPGEHFAA